jgi:hypothetical protein
MEVAVMPAKTRRVSDLPTDKAIRKLFPKAVVETAKKAASQPRKKPAKRK